MEIASASFFDQLCTLCLDNIAVTSTAQLTKFSLQLTLNPMTMDQKVYSTSTLKSAFDNVVAGSQCVLYYALVYLVVFTFVRCLQFSGWPEKNVDPQCSRTSLELLPHQSTGI